MIIQRLFTILSPVVFTHLVSSANKLNDKFENFVITEDNVGLGGLGDLGLDFFETFSGFGHSQDEADVSLGADVDAGLVHDVHDALGRSEVAIVTMT